MSPGNPCTGARPQPVSLSSETPTIPGPILPPAHIPAGPPFPGAAVCDFVDGLIPRLILPSRTFPWVRRFPGPLLVVSSTMPSAALVKKIEGDPERIVWQLSVSPDRKQIAVHYSDSIAFSDVATGMRHCVYEHPLVSSRGRFVDNDHYVFATTAVVNVYSTVQKRHVWVIGVFRVMRLRVHPTMPRFFVSQTGKVVGYDIPTRQEIGEWPADYHDVWLLGCYDDWLLLGGRGLVKINTTTGDNEILSTDIGYFNACLSPDGRRLVHQWDDHVVRITDLVTGRQKDIELNARTMTTFGFMDDGRRGVAQSRNARGDEYTLVDLVAGTSLQTFRYGSWARMGGFLYRDIVPVTNLNDSTVNYLSFCPFWTRAVHPLLSRECRAMIETVLLCWYRMGNVGVHVSPLPALPSEMWLHILSFCKIGKDLDTVSKTSNPV